MKLNSMKKFGGGLLLFLGIIVMSGTTAQAQYPWPNQDQYRRQRDYERQQRERELQRQRERQNRQGGWYDQYGNYHPNGSYDQNNDYNNQNGYYNQGRRGRSWDGYGNYGGSYELRQTALNAGYNEGMKAGRNDRRSGRYDPTRNSAYRNATKDYNSRMGDRYAYQQYFRAAFENGYSDGYNGY